MEFLCAVTEKECSAPGRELSSLSLGQRDWVRDESFLGGTLGAERCHTY